jgi:tRNA-2-methylthio-N6-dimethylallyladenosine synthase
VPETEKTARIVRLQSLQREIQTRLHEAMVGTTEDVLIDSISRRQDAELSGRTSGNVVVNVSLPADTQERERTGWVGRLARVRITRGGPHSVRGVMETAPRPEGY